LSAVAPMGTLLWLNFGEIIPASAECSFAGWFVIAVFAIVAGNKIA
jgi:hypothetical protein